MSGAGAMPLLLALAMSASFVLALLAFAELARSDRLAWALRLARIGAKPKADADNAADALRRDVSDSSIPTLDRLIKRYLPNPDKLRELLARTGRRISLGEYLLGCALLAAVTELLLGLILAWPPLVAIPLAVTVGLALPHKLVTWMANSRARAFMLVFPEAVDLIVRGLKSGIPVIEAMKSVGSELPDPVAVEFRRTLDAFNLGIPLNQALFDTADRLVIPDFRFFAISISIQQQTGGNLAETLENLTDILRRRRQMALKVRAMSSEARATAMIVGSLPFLVFAALTIIDPTYIGILLHDPRGNIVLGAASVSLFTGAGIMRKMARFEI